MVARKPPPEPTRRVWRMTAESPMGEYLELVPKEAYDRTADGAPKRVLHPETRDPIYRTPSSSILPSPSPSPSPSSTRPAEPPKTDAPASLRSSHPSKAAAAAADADPPTVSEVKARVLKPAQVESWRASSYDLLTGCTVRDVTDTIPGEIFDELFEPDPLRRFLTSASKRRG
jgi:hypothetical protein